MSAASSRHGALLFRGPPLALSAVADPLPAASAARLPIRLSPPLAAAAQHVELHTLAADQGPAVLRLTLPRTTPPGTYRGVVRVGDRDRDVEITVDPQPCLRFVPDRLALTGAPGARVPVALTVANLGNVAVTVRAAYAFGLFEVGGADRAIGRAFSGDPAGGARRVDSLVDALADAHGGAIRVKIDSGSGDIAAGAWRALSATFTLPARLRAGVTYWGTWPLDYARYYVRVTGAGGAPSEETAT